MLSLYLGHPGLSMQGSVLHGSKLACPGWCKAGPDAATSIVPSVRRIWQVTVQLPLLHNVSHRCNSVSQQRCPRTCRSGG